MKLDYSHVLQNLVNAKVDFTVIGGFAVVAHGVIRVTMDLDLSIVLKKENLEKLWICLESQGFKPKQPISHNTFTTPAELLEIARKKNMKAVSFYNAEQPYLIVDVLFEKEFQLDNSERMQVELFGVNCYIARIEKLIEMKQNTGREKDRADVRELSKIKK